MYKRIKAIDGQEMYDELIDEMTDRFGDMPAETERLMHIALIRASAMKVGVESIKEKNKIVRIQFSETGSGMVDGAKIVSDSMQFGRAVGFSFEENKLALTIDERKVSGELPFDVLEKLVLSLPDALKEA